MNISNNEDIIELFNRLLEQLQQAGGSIGGSHFQLVYVAPGAQHVEKIGMQQVGEVHRAPSYRQLSPHKGEVLEERIRQCIARLMAKRYGDEPLFNLQCHWQAVYRILVDKGYCRDSDFDGFDTFIRRVMPDQVNKPYTKASVKQISQTDFSRAFDAWTFDYQTSKTRRPYDRMVAVAQHFRELLEGEGL